MSISMEEAAKRIIICGYEEVTSNIDDRQVGQVMVARDLRYKIDYKGVNKHTCYTPNDDHCLPPSEQQDKLRLIRADLDAATSFLEQRTDNLLIHCAEGIFFSPSFTFLLLLHLQGDKPNLYKAANALFKIKPKSSLFGGCDYFPYIPAEKADLEKFISDYGLVKRVMMLLQTDYSVADTFRHCANSHDPPISPKNIIEVCSKFGLELPTNTALCGADNDRPKRTPA